MNSKEAIKKLKDAGYIFIRMGRGSHMIFEKDSKRIVIPVSDSDLSLGMAGKVRSACYIKPQK